MASFLLPFTLPTVPEGYKPPTSYAKLSAPVSRSLYPVGPSYIAHARRVEKNLTFEEDDQLEAAEAARLAALKGDVQEENDDDIGSEPETRELLARDPKEWKSQDHYQVLGLSHLRHKATPDQIKRAHRKRVLKHHPDKKANSGDSNDDSFFKCIAKAHEILFDPVKRRQFDSVDPAIDDDEAPSRSELQSMGAEEFFEVFGPIFEKESRFSGKKPVASLGTMDSAKADVESFYDFWYNFDSWRSFEYKDKEINEGADSRDDKRYAEKKNKAERARLKKEDNARLRNIVDAALSADPRIKKFKADEKAARAQKKGGAGKAGAGGPAAAAAKAAEEKKKKEEVEKAKIEKEKKDAEDKVARDANKKVKEAAKKNLKRDKKAINTIVTSSNYFLPEGESPSPAVIEAQLGELDAIAETLEPEDVGALRKEMEAVDSKDRPAVKNVVKKFAEKAKEKGAKREFKEFA